MLACSAVDRRPLEDPEALDLRLALCENLPSTVRCRWLEIERDGKRLAVVIGG